MLPLFGSAAWAAEAEAEPPAGIGDIVVTAQKTGAESLQKVPISMSAVSGETLAKANSVSITDVGRLVPNAQLQPGPRGAFANFTIRGIGLNGTVRSVDPSISLVQDGMVLAYPMLTLLDTFDVEGVEVLRGPQGILFGRNATGGAVSFRSARPTDHLQVRAEVTGGSYNRFDQALAISGPIVSDKLLGRLTVIHRQRDGFAKDENRGIFVPSINNPSGVDNGWKGREVDVDHWLVRPMLLFRPTDNFDFTLIGEYVHVDDGGFYVQTASPNALLQREFGYTPQLTGWQINNHYLPEGKDPWTKGSAWRVSGEINWELGPGTLTSITGYRKTSMDETNDPDGIPFPFLAVNPGSVVKTEQVSEELRFLLHLTDRFDLLVGSYYNYMTLHSVDRRSVSTLNANSPVQVNMLRHIQAILDQDATALAGFANLSWQLLDNLRITAGGRYSWEQKVIEGTPFQICSVSTSQDFDNTPCPRPIYPGRKDWNNFSPRATIDFQVTPDILLYGSWTNGFRSGQFNSQAQKPEELGPVNPEKVEAFEIGWKSTFWDRRARLNVSLFHQKYDDIQRTVQGPNITQRLENAAKATIQGFEVESSLQPVEGLQLDANVGYTHAAYDEFLKLDLTGDGIPDPQLAKNLKFDRVPAWTATGAASYAAELGSGMTLTGRGSYTYRSSYYLEVTNRKDAHQNGYGIVDASLSLQKDNWTLTAFGKNLSNSRSKEFVNLFPYGAGFFFGEPRTYGVTLGFSY